MIQFYTFVPRSQNSDIEKIVGLVSLIELSNF